MNTNPLANLSYGLFVLSTRDGDADNGCIVNTVMQITDNPKRILIGLNKSNHTHSMVLNTGKLNISILSQKSSFDTFRQFGFKSGRDEDKFSEFANKKRSANGIYYITDEANSYLCCTVESSIDLDTHTLFIATVDDANMLNNDASVTYSYYHSNIKPHPAPAANTAKKQWVCTICGYIYEGEELPADFICPLCKHGTDDFSPVE